MNQLDTSVCIVGAGPAGLSAAFFLSKQNVSFVMIDANTFPRDKVCGESYDGRVYRTLNEIDPSFIPEMQNAGIIEFSWSNQYYFGKHPFSVSFPESGTPNIKTQRSEFDAFLMGKLSHLPNVRLIQHEPLLELSEKAESVVLSTKKYVITARAVIMAVGAQSKFSTVDRSSKVFYQRGYYRNVKTEGSTMEVHQMKKPVRGTLCINPVSRGLCSVQVGVGSASLKKKKLAMNEVFEAYLNDSLVKAKFDGAEQVLSPKGTFMPFQNKLATMDSKRVLGIGAALISVNPMTGMGVGNAMKMGKLAALHLANSLSGGNGSSLNTERFYEQVKHELRHVLWLNWAFNAMSRYALVVLPVMAFFTQIKWFRNINLATDFSKKIVFWKP